MPKIRIKQMDDRIATQGVHMGGDRRCRKLEPGEIVEIPEGELFEGLWDTGRIEMTMDDVTRPLVFETEDEARYCSPSFKAHDPSEERDSAIAREAVAKRLINESVAVAPKEPASSVADAKPEAKKAVQRPTNRRAAARQRQNELQAANG